MNPNQRPMQSPVSPQQLAQPAVSQTVQKGSVLSDQPQLADMVHNAQEVLCRARSFFLLSLFPDSVRVDREKITVTHRSFFRTGDTISLHIDDILSITARMGPLFGSLQFHIRNAPQRDAVEVKNLTRHDVMCVKNIVQGYMIARQNNVDTTDLSRKQLIEMLQRLGSGKSIK